ncbi:hypothetical protein P7K49_018955, partial [Saguinus oedipus]
KVFQEAAPVGQPFLLLKCSVEVKEEVIPDAWVSFLNTNEEHSLLNQQTESSNCAS